MKRRSFQNIEIKNQYQPQHTARNNKENADATVIKRQWPSAEKMRDRPEKEKAQQETFHRHQVAINHRNEPNKQQARPPIFDRRQVAKAEPKPTTTQAKPLQSEKGFCTAKTQQSENNLIQQKKPEVAVQQIIKKQNILQDINNLQESPRKQANKDKNYTIKMKKQDLNESQRERIRNLKITVENSDKTKEDGTIPIKLVLVGDGSVGKTSMLISYTTDNFPTDYIPTIFDNYIADVKLGSNKVKLWLWDTAGQQQYAQLRLISYQKADVFLICFSMIDQNSFRNALDKWFPQVQEESPKAIKIMVGTKYDLHQEYLEDKKTIHQAIPLDYINKQCEIKKCAFMPCSGLNQKGLNEVFTKAMSIVIDRVERKKKEESSLCQMI